MIVRTTPEDFLRSVDDAKAVRRQERFLERATENRLLDPWERYRVLTDQCDRLTDVAEQGDRKTRFALLILGGINAVNLLIVTQGDMSGGPNITNPAVVAYVACYVFLSLCFFVYAIKALRPRSPETEEAGGASGRPLLHLDDEALREPAAVYAGRWQQAQIGEMNAELATMIHTLSRNNVRKLRALQRVYLGLYVLVGLTAMALVVLAVTRFGQ
ncbi:MAG: hypothetical protein HOP16_07940 [Acidobacteria bacterium]|nr:hypothetical protein [Acidobacteriota bacterium]